MGNSPPSTCEIIKVLLVSGVASLWLAVGAENVESSVYLEALPQSGLASRIRREVPMVGKWYGGIKRRGTHGGQVASEIRRGGAHGRHVAWHD